MHPPRFLPRCFALKAGRKSLVPSLGSVPGPGCRSPAQVCVVIGDGCGSRGGGAHRYHRRPQHLFRSMHPQPTTATPPAAAPWIARIPLSPERSRQALVIVHAGKATCPAEGLQALLGFHADGQGGWISAAQAEDGRWGFIDAEGRWRVRAFTTSASSAPAAWPARFRGIRRATSACTALWTGRAAGPSRRVSRRPSPSTNWTPPPPRSMATVGA